MCDNVENTLFSIYCQNLKEGEKSPHHLTQSLEQMILSWGWRIVVSTVCSLLLNFVELEYFWKFELVAGLTTGQSVWIWSLAFILLPCFTILRAILLYIWEHSFFSEDHIVSFIMEVYGNIVFWLQNYVLYTKYMFLNMYLNMYFLYLFSAVYIFIF